ncbi:hypothetical protein [Mesorhizobium sp. LSJC255A00]|uniref:hypothetical protein n=1 Tax=Mesorhizobium sp. LSJC255A00 TaxID=1287313 RepID=UPI0018DB0F5A|nr:hypothetical protein [Mesorhizobium sp. LSJC255A00]
MMEVFREAPLNGANYQGVHEVVTGGGVAGLEAALAAVKPSATCGDVAAAFNKTIRKYWFEKKSQRGYAIGIETEPTASLKLVIPPS